MIIIPKEKKNQLEDTGNSFCATCKKSYSPDISSYDNQVHGFVCPNCGK
jgi:predicted RNA-binding Zn-ribbon protein involved in translation (DUF1610 family)